VTGARRHAIVQWLRRVHGWIGLWGAVLGLLFGLTGVLLNHRALMKLPAARTQERTLQLAVPRPAPGSANAMANWVRDELALGGGMSRAREEPARPAAWNRTLIQPTRWTATIATPRTSYQVEYWVGNPFIDVRAVESNLFATLNNLHKGGGLGVAWVLLADTIGGAMMLLSLTGVLLWTQLNRRRLIELAIAAVSTTVTIGLVVAAL
jgi:uncharacterized protein